MKNIAIVEDEDEALSLIMDCIQRFTRENGIEFNTVVFRDAVSFLTNYKPNYDIVFMDIKLPNLNGMDAARKLRELDNFVALIFVTNMSQYAVKGYEVQAIDFIVKPVVYYNFALKLQRALESVEENKDVKIPVFKEGNVVCLLASEIKYIEVFKHSIVFHTIKGDIPTYGSLKKIEDILPKNSFARCNSCYLVNLRYVTKVKQLEVYLGETILQISRLKKRAFLSAINDYLGGGI